MTKLKKAAFLVVARCLSSEEISGLRQLFRTIDTDNSGTITVDELKVCTCLLFCTLFQHAFSDTVCLHFDAVQLWLLDKHVAHCIRGLWYACICWTYTLRVLLNQSSSASHAKGM